MNYAQLRQYDVANGEGIRVTLFISGCHFSCENCFNKDYQNFSYGKPFTTEIKKQILTWLQDDNIAGLSVLGGEPLQQGYELYELIREIKEDIIERNSKQTIWVWTGYEYENLNDNQKMIVEIVDVLVDGRYIDELKDLRLKFKGSSNQRIIDIKSTIENKYVIEYTTV